MWLTLFILSSATNILFLLYVRWLLKSIVAMNEDVTSVSILIGDFALHLKSIHELEMFYGDETLGALMKHSKELGEKLQDLDLILSPSDEEVEILEKEGEQDDK